MKRMTFINVLASFEAIYSDCDRVKSHPFCCGCGRTVTRTRFARTFNIISRLKSDNFGDSTSLNRQ